MTRLHPSLVIALVVVALANTGHANGGKAPVARLEALEALVEDLAARQASLEQANAELSSQVASLDAQNAALRSAQLEQAAELDGLHDLWSGVSRETDGDTGIDTIRFSGVNVQIVNGLGDTHLLNGAGNLILGYNLRRADAPVGPEPLPDDRSGSHNLIVGDLNNYAASAGLVVGSLNDELGRYGVVFGNQNRVGGISCAVTGGQHQYAGGLYSNVGGGLGNVADGVWCAVGGGVERMTDGYGTWADGD